MKTRLITAGVGLVVLGVIMALFHTPVFETTIAVVTLIALYEIYKAFQMEKGGKMIFAGTVPYVLVLVFSQVLGIEIDLLLIGFLFLIYIAICVVKHIQTLDFRKMAAFLLFGTIVVTCFYSLIWLKYSFPKEDSGYDAIYVIFLILGFAWGGDSAAYFAGRFFGKHKLAPIVSPNKTVEGAVGGVLGSVALGLIITMIYGLIAKEQAMGGLTVRYYVSVSVLAVIGSLLGILGDLFASAIKRQCGIKDYGYIFPGHGGILDRFDSILFITPFVVLGIIAMFQG